MNGRLEEIVVPRNQEFADYYQGIADAVRRIAFYENRRMESVLSDLVALHSDVLRIRITGKNVEATKNTFIGKVISLNGVENEDGHMEGDVIFSLLIDEESLKAKGFLKPEFYRDACDAHKDSKYIKISTILREKPRISDLDQISVLEVLSE
jgi:hypothetical protein